jgi:hypothetical protein
MMLPNADPAWDYYSIAETLLHMDETRKEISKLLTQPEAEEGNPKTDQEILEAIAKIKDDCIGIQKALDGQDDDLNDLFEYDDKMTFGDKKQEIERLFKQLPSDMRGDILKV